MHIGFWWDCQKERDHWEDLDEGGRIILLLVGVTYKTGFELDY
jgi:hypothetical protein